MKKVILLIVVVVVVVIGYRYKTFVVGTATGSFVHWGVALGKHDFVEEQIKAGTDPDLRDYYGHTPLHWAVWFTDVPMIDLLVDNGASINAMNDAGMTPLTYSSLEDKYKEAFNALLQKGADPNAKGGESSWTTMMFAAGFGLTDPEIYSTLVAWGADVNAVGGGANYTALHNAASDNNLAVAEILLDLGANVNVITANGQSPLDSAVIIEELTGQSTATIVEYLKDRGGRCNTTCLAGWQQQYGI